MLVLNRRKRQKIQYGDEETVTVILTVLEVRPTFSKVRIETAQTTSEIDLLVSHKRQIAGEIYACLREIKPGKAMNEGQIRICSYAPDSIKIMRGEIDERRIVI